ncbi:hypothetical protein D3C75_1135820 [compost metagenome]
MDQDKALGGGFFQADVESVILFLVDQHVLLRIAAHHVAIDLIRQQCLGMFTHIVNGGGIIRPLEVARGVFQHLIGPAIVA